MKNTEQILLKEIRDLKRKFGVKDKEIKSLSRELARIKNGIKTIDIAMIVDGNDMIDWGWSTHERYNKLVKDIKKIHPTFTI